ncbi:MAG: hypothetical protein QXV46_05000, partial [Candidatus Bathyarchaeia archaeon]
MYLSTLEAKFRLLSDIIVPSLTSKVTRTILANLFTEIQRGDLITLLKSAESCKPYSVSLIMSQDGRPIFKTSEDHSKFTVLESSNIYKFYICFSHEDMMLDVAKALAEKRDLKLFNTEVYISDAVVNVKHFNELRLGLGRFFHIQFLSPTMFAVSGGMQ